MGEPLAKGSIGLALREEERVIVIEPAAEATSELIDAFARLVPQLSHSSPPPVRPN